MMPSPASFPFVRALQQRGARVYTVGGTVRDELLGHPRKDLDLLVTGLPQPDLLRYLRPYGRVQLTGRAFGVIKLLPHGWDGPPIDVALPRTEISTGIGHRDFEVTFDHMLPVETDLGRRDFTINAMAIDLADGHLLDPFGGYEDLQQRRLRQVSTVAFPEDPLRMLRGIQLAARFALQIEPATRESMRTHAAAITTVAPERIAEELRKLFQARAPSQGFVVMHEVGLLMHILPELARLADGAAFTRTMRRLDAVQQCERLSYRGDLDLLLAALLGESGLSVPRQTGTRWKPKDLAQASARLARQRLEALRITTIGARPALISALIAQSAFEVSALATPAALRHFTHAVGCTEAFMLFELRLADRLGNAPEQAIDDLLDLRQRLRTAMDQKIPLSLKDLAVNGDDLQRLGIPPGRRLGQILQTLLDHVLDDPMQNSRVRLLALAQAAWDLPPHRATD
jgi:tRNA nucleotidyltransferase/poly(A) polymerase